MTIASSMFNLRAWQSFCTTSLQVLFGLLLGLDWSPPPHSPHISLPNQCLLFAKHAHAIAACFAVVPRLYHLFLISLSITWDFMFYLSVLISACWSTTLFSFLTGQVSLPCSIYYFAHNCSTASRQPTNKVVSKKPSKHVSSTHTLRRWSQLTHGLFGEVLSQSILLLLLLLISVSVAYRFGILHVRWGL